MSVMDQDKNKTTPQSCLNTDKNMKAIKWKTQTENNQISISDYSLSALSSF